MGFASLGSGSRGNGTLISLGGTSDELPQQLFLVDCGFTLKQTEQRLQRLGLGGGDISAIFVTHEHADHIGGVAALAHKYAIDVYTSYGTLKHDLKGVKAIPFDGDVPFTVGGVQVNPVRVPHDAKEPTQFVFNDGQQVVGVLSDLGCVTSHVVEQFLPCTHLLLEANHDRDMLRSGSYPPRLKQRVGADFGHLSNEQSWHLLDRLAHPELNVVLGHISEQNNDVTLLRQQFANFNERVGQLALATQDDGFDWVGSKPLTRQISFANLV